MKTEIEVTDAMVIRCMVSHGGSFVSALGEAAKRADNDNLNRIKTAFPEYWQLYSRFAGSHAKFNAMLGVQP